MKEKKEDTGSLPTKIAGKLTWIKRKKAALGLPLVWNRNLN